MTNETSRKLASAQRIKDLTAIENSDFLETAWINGWPVVVQKDKFSVDELVVYFEIDSLLPMLPCFAFLAARCLRKTEHGPKYLLKTVRLRGQISQGLVMPVSDFEGLTALTSGMDLTETLSVLKYERLDNFGNSCSKGSLPWFLSKTDETRAQNLRDYTATVDSLTDWYATEKLEGSSMQVGLFKGEFFVCSRNVDLIEKLDCFFWATARRLNIEAKLRSLSKDDIAIQGELIGPKIQGNIYKLDKHQFRLYGATDLLLQRKLQLRELDNLCDKLSLRMVPIVDLPAVPRDLETLLWLADGMSELNKDVLREGLVIRSATDQSSSFKAISNAYLLKQK